MTADIDPEIERLLTSEPLMAHLATCSDNKPHVAPVWYDYAGGVVEVLTTGRKLANIRANPRVALSIQKDERGQAEWMVSLLGTAEVVEDEEETRAAEARKDARPAWLSGSATLSFPTNSTGSSWQSPWVLARM